ncbi:type II secretion system protein [Campylobacter canadensis]|uniref:Type II secretion system protein n=1 Tax=Campylobacter canadensis TaxID=449520 RepID=A0ABS7WPE5_9BACT|nr:type II secretion system protein [Campylobacter canadensis]MBZ7986643.1 type II secretion system protein [Campylobacter canadensis]MBZ7993952.1 type II secretion system protein [Campylobacter canadensis]MBZ7996268.1 type II secretion system protein [Campylobacter canadensis]MBZ7997679.1 type II secretion system protein [Campylobacter canadensis]MBZ7999285.1 type II secretion system protein [Campylobacter canadensis]
MKKAFSMIELIFVITILGILAAFAIPKLNATRDDAAIATAASNLPVLLSDVGFYYTSKLDFNDIKVMTNVKLEDDKFFMVGNEKCLEFSVDKSDAYMIIKKVAGIKANGLCEKFLAIKSIEALLTARDAKGSSNFVTLKTNDTIYYPLAYNAVVF